MMSNAKYLSWWFLPVMLHSIYQLLIHSWRIYVFYDLVENISFVLIILLFVSLFNNQKWQKFLSKAAFIIFILTLLFEGLYYDIFATYFSSSALFIFLQTNTAEAFEFSETYLDSAMLFNVIIAIFFIIGFMYRSKVIMLKNTFNQAFYIKIIVIGLLAFFLRESGYIIANVPYAIVNASVEYYQEQQKMQAYQH